MSALPASLTPKDTGITRAMKVAGDIRDSFKRAGFSAELENRGNGWWDVIVTYADGQLYRVCIERELDAMRREIREAS